MMACRIGPMACIPRHQKAARGARQPRLPTSCRALARILERLDQGLYDVVAGRIGFRLAPERALQRVHDRDAKIQSLDTLRRPVGRDVVARYAPHLLGVGLEEELEQALAEPIAHPIMEA